MENLSVDELKEMLKKKKKQKRKKVKRKWRFSEKVILFILLFSIAVFIAAIVYAFLKDSESMWAYLLPSVGVLASSAFAVFVWKEKNENLPKILKNPNYDQEQLAEQIRYELEEEYKNLGR